MKLFLCFCLSCFTCLLLAQKVTGNLNLFDEDQRHYIELTNGTKRFGRIMSMSKARITFSFKKEMIPYERTEVLTIEAISLSQIDPAIRKLIETYPNINANPKVIVNSPTQNHLLSTSLGNILSGKITRIGTQKLDFQENEKEMEIALSQILAIEVEVVGGDTSDVVFQTNPALPTTEASKDTLILTFNLSNIIASDFDLSNQEQKHILTTKRGDRFIGRVSQLETEVIFQTETASILTFNITEIKEIGVVEEKYTYKKSKNGDYLIAMPIKEKVEEGNQILMQHRLFANQTALGISSGSKEYRNTMLFLNEFSYSGREQFTAGGGFVPFIVFNILSGHAKFSTEISNNVHFGLGAQGFFGFVTSGFGDNFTAIMPFTALTFGSPKSYLNLAYHRWTSSESNANIIGAGFSILASKNVRFYVDLMVVDDIDYDETTTFILPGISWIGNRNKFDVGIGLFPAGSNDIDLIPFPTGTYVRQF